MTEITNKVNLIRFKYSWVIVFVKKYIPLLIEMYMTI
jgi:hypothetical protein